MNNTDHWIRECRGLGQCVLAKWFTMEPRIPSTRWKMASYHCAVSCGNSFGSELQGEASGRCTGEQVRFVSLIPRSMEGVNLNP
jgi:hypothetical protein